MTKYPLLANNTLSPEFLDPWAKCTLALEINRLFFPAAQWKTSCICHFDFEDFEPTAPTFDTLRIFRKKIDDQKCLLRTFLLNQCISSEWPNALHICTFTHSHWLSHSDVRQVWHWHQEVAETVYDWHFHTRTHYKERLYARSQASCCKWFKDVNYGWMDGCVPTYIHVHMYICVKMLVHTCSCVFVRLCLLINQSVLNSNSSKITSKWHD